MTYVKSNSRQAADSVLSSCGMAAVPPASVSAELEELIHALRDIQQVNYWQVSALTALVYDIAITFGDEVEYIWKSRWAMPKFLFLFARYFALIHVIIVVLGSSFSRPSLAFCRFYFWEDALGGLPVFTAVTGIILLLRIHSLYGQNKKILTFLIILLISELIVEYYCTIKDAIFIANNTFNAPPGVPLTGCLTRQSSYRYTIPAWVVCTVVAATFFGMTLAKFIQLFRVHWRTTQMRDLGYLSPFLTAFLRDGVIFFLLPFIVILISAGTVLGLSGPLEGISIPWCIVIYSVSACRLVMDLRIELAAYAEATSSCTMTAMEFMSSQVTPAPVL